MWNCEGYPQGLGKPWQTFLTRPSYLSDRSGATIEPLGVLHHPEDRLFPRWDICPYPAPRLPATVAPRLPATVATVKPPSPSMAAFLKRQATRAKDRKERDADIRQSLGNGATLAELGRKYQITMERVRQIARIKGA